MMLSGRSRDRRNPECPGRVSVVVLLLLALFLSSPGRAQQETLDPLLQSLFADDQKSAAAAHGVLVTISEGTDPKASEYREFVQRILDPANLAERTDHVAVADKLVAAMGILSAADSPFPGGADLMLGLLGTGPESLRRTVREALRSLIRRELSEGPRSPTLESLGRRIAHNSAPPPDVLTEASRVLWDVDGKALLGLLVEGMKKNNHPVASEDPGSEAGEDATSSYIVQLRRRLLLDLHTVEDWSAWWEANRDRSLESILDDARAVVDQRRARLWKQTIQRIKDTASPEPYLGTLIDTFMLDLSTDVRIAVLDELGSFPLWLQDTRFPKGPLDPAVRDGLVARAVSFLLNVLLEREEIHHLPLDIKAEAVAALGSYHGALDRQESLREPVIEALLEALERHDPMASGNTWNLTQRAYTLELVRTVGLLRISNEKIRGFLRTFLSDESRPVQRDAEMVTLAVGSLGKLLTRQAHTESVELILDLYERHRDRKEKAWRDLRKTCVSALNLPVEKGPVRDRVRALYQEILDRSGDEPEKIPAIIGLGILAKDGDDAAAGVLVDVLRRRTKFEVSQVHAVVDALAYLGSRKALSCFFQFFGVDDQPFAEQIWKKTVNLIKSDDSALFEWLVGELQQRGFQADNIDFARVLMRLSQEPELADLFSVQKLSLEAREPVVRFWTVFMARLRALVLVGSEEEALASAEAMAAFLEKSEAMSTLLPGAREELDAARAELQLKRAARSALEASPLPAASELLPAFTAILEHIRSSNGSPLRRWQTLAWIRLNLQRLEPSDPAHALASALAEELARAANDAASPIWRDIPPEVRTSFLGSLQAEVDRLKSAKPGG